jgi:hypothetical protein
VSSFIRARSERGEGRKAESESVRRDRCWDCEGLQ